MDKSKQWEAEKEQFAMQIAAFHVPNNEIYQDGFKLLELASRAYPLYSKQSAEQKNRLLRILLSNCTLQAGTLRPIYKKPFDILAKGVEKENWGE
jgi:site-specific DNA recombinase